jgi:hypothetical protein
MRQVDNFAIATPDSRMADIVMDLIDNKLSIPIKCQGYLNMFNGINILQTQHYNRINVKTFMDKVFERHFLMWMKTSYPTLNCFIPLPLDPDWIKKFNLVFWRPGPQVPVQSCTINATHISIWHRQIDLGHDHVLP